MKWIFWTLLAANILYLGFNLTFLRGAENEDLARSPQGNLPEVKLLSERKGMNDRAIEVAEVLENPISVVDDAMSPVCRGLGPFEDVVSAQNAAERLNAVGFSVEMRAVDVPTGVYDYRVILPPLPSLQEAFRRLRELKSRNIDSYVIPEGEDAQGISLGVFSSKEASLSHQERLGDEGYRVEIRRIERVTRGYWLYGALGFGFPDGQIAGVISEFVGVKVTETACLN